MQHIIEIKQRGLTPRNISPTKKSTIIQIAVQHQSNNEKENQRITVSFDQNKAYESAVTTKLEEASEVETGNRIIGIRELNDGINSTFCRPCVENKLETIETDTVLDFEKLYFENEKYMTPTAIFETFKRNKKRNHRRNLDRFYKKAKMTVSDKTIGQSSNLIVHCNNEDNPHAAATHCLLERRMKHKKGCICKHNTNLIFVIAPFIAGIGPSEMTDVNNILDLPNAKNLDRAIRRHQPEVAQAIIKVSEREMRMAMADEIKTTICEEKSKEYYEKWINLPFNEIGQVDLVVSFDMRWQRRSSGHAYNSMSGHAFVIDKYTRKIIDCVVYSTACKQCELNDKKKVKENIV